MLDACPWWFLCGWMAVPFGSLFSAVQYGSIITDPGGGSNIPNNNRVLLGKLAWQRCLGERGPFLGCGSLGGRWTACPSCKSCQSFLLSFSCRSCFSWFNPFFNAMQASPLTRASGKYAAQPCILRNRCNRCVPSFQPDHLISHLAAARTGPGSRHVAYLHGTFGNGMLFLLELEAPLVERRNE